MTIKIPLEISNRHVHLSRKDIDVLFGKNHQLKIRRELSQPGEFAAEEKVTLDNNGHKIENVRVVGPERRETQAELLKSDCKKLGIDVPVRESGNIAGTPGITLVGPKGSVAIKHGLIIAQRHLHASEEDAKKLNLKDRQVVKIKANDAILDNVIVRIGKNYRRAAHIDKEEADSVCMNVCGFCEIVTT